MNFQEAAALAFILAVGYVFFRILWVFVKEDLNRYKQFRELELGKAADKQEPGKDMPHD